MSLPAPPGERVVSATVNGQRRTMRVSDLPIAGEGVAGYAVDIEQMEELTRQFRRFRDAQRQMLDTLSAAIAQFDAGRNLVFANQPFLRIFGISPPGSTIRRRSIACSTGCAMVASCPKCAIFPNGGANARPGSWRAPREEPWHLHDGTHLRVVGQPMPDGGLLLIFEDQTEQLQLSPRATPAAHAHRHVRQPVRVARRVRAGQPPAIVEPALRHRLGLDEEFLGTHPRADHLLTRLAPCCAARRKWA
jgi:PAS domain-containing protein